MPSIMPSNCLDAITCQWMVQDRKFAKPNKKPRFRGVFGYSGTFRKNELVPRRGLEPPLPCENYDLNVARLPIPPSGHWRGFRGSGRCCQRQNAQPSKLSCICFGCGASGKDFTSFLPAAAPREVAMSSGEAGCRPAAVATGGRLIVAVLKSNTAQRRPISAAAVIRL